VVTTRSSIVKLLIVGLLIREAFSFWTGHPEDFELWVRLGYYVAHGANPYVALPPVPGLSFSTQYGSYEAPVIVYLPFWPLVTAGAYLLYTLLGFGDRFVYYFILKQPEILGDLLLGYLVYRFILPSSESKAIDALRFWMFFPLSILISAIWGMFDSLAMSLVLLALVSATSLRKSLWTGFAVLAKSIPMVFVLPILPPTRRNIWATLLALALPAVTTLAVLDLMGWSFGGFLSAVWGVVPGIGESMSAWDVFFFLYIVGVSPGLLVPLASALALLWIPAVVAAALYGLWKFGYEGKYAMVQTMILCVLAFLLFKARVNEQYSLYLIPLGLIDVALWHPERKKLLYLTAAVTMLFLLVNNNFLIGFLAPIYPSAVQIDLSVSFMLGLYRYGAKLLLGTLFTVFNVLYLLRVIRSPRVPPISAEPLPSSALGASVTTNEPPAL